MKFVIFTHAITSCWNNGNAHFLRGVARELVRAGHHVTVFEPIDGWSRLNALQDGGSLTQADVGIPAGVVIRLYHSERLDLAQALDGADVVVVHEWNDADLVSRIGERRLRGGRFTLLFHDTHHRAITAPHELERFDLDGYDGVLAFGEVLRQVYLNRGWGRRAFTWHEAADTELFRPCPSTQRDTDLIWIGNWGDEERTEELEEFLIAPVQRLRLKARVFGVRYPQAARERLAAADIHYGGWLPNHRAPREFARSRATVHVPRRPYTRQLRGIPTIRVFEALACGVPLVSAPWEDVENLFPPGCFITARSGEEMGYALDLLMRDDAFAAEMIVTGLHAIRSRHTCEHRVFELLDILKTIGPAEPDHEWMPAPALDVSV